jgi:hypothetical protein
MQTQSKPERMSLGCSKLMRLRTVLVVLAQGLRAQVLASVQCSPMVRLTQRWHSQLQVPVPP